MQAVFVSVVKKD